MSTITAHADPDPVTDEQKNAAAEPEPTGPTAGHAALTLEGVVALVNPDNSPYIRVRPEPDGTFTVQHIRPAPPDAPLRPLAPGELVTPLELIP